MVWNFISIFKNASSPGNISCAPKIDYATGDNAAGIAVADLDQDGKPDIAVVNQFSNTFSVFRNMSTSGNISLRKEWITRQGVFPFAISAKDITSDGRPDIVVTNLASGTISIFRNKISGRGIDVNSFDAKIDLATGNFPFKVIAEDLNGDRRTDLAI